MWTKKHCKKDRNLTTKKCRKSAQKLHVSFEWFFRCNSQYVFETSGLEVFGLSALKSRSGIARKMVFRNKSVMSERDRADGLIMGFLTKNPWKTRKTELKSSILEICKNSQNPTDFVRFWRSTMRPAAKSPKEPTISTNNFGGLLVCEAEYWIPRRKRRAIGVEGPFFGPILLLSLNCPLGQKRKPYRLAVFKGRGKGEGGIGEGMKRKYFQKTYGNEDILLVNLK